jgi:hypothetical protein
VCIAHYHRTPEAGKSFRERTRTLATAPLSRQGALATPRADVRLRGRGPHPYRCGWRGQGPEREGARNARHLRAEISGKSKRMRACYELAFSVNCSSTMLAREKPLFTGCVEGEYGEVPLNGVLRRLHEPLDSLSLSSESPAIVGVFGARRLSQQSLSFPSPEKVPTRIYEGIAQVDHFGTLRQAWSTVTT